jgi:predicted phosphodiesterase
MNDLKPDTQYHYQVNNGQIAYFSTPSIDGQLHFAVASDAHFASPNSRNDLTESMLSEIASPDNGFDMFFFIGDLVEYGFLDSQWEEAFNAINIATANIPVRYAAGNHDTIFSGLNNYLNYCVPQGLDSNTESRLWSRIDIGSVHFLVLDVEWSAETYTEAQADWLEEQLKDIPRDDWTIVLSHGFYYASGIYSYGWNWYDNPETIKAITPLFDEYQADLVCSGHVHSEEMLEENGVKYAVCGAFGGLPDPGRTYTSPASVWYSDGQYAFLDVSVEEDQCTLTFRDCKFEALYAVTIDKNN